MMQAIGSSLIYTLLVNGEIWTKRLSQQCTPASVQEATFSSIGIGCLTSSSIGIVCSTSSSIGIGSSESDDVNPFINMQTFKQYLLKHPVTTDYVKSILATGIFTILARQAITRLVVHKMINVFGNYPTRRHKEDVASLLGQLFSMEASIFFDPSTYSGFLQRGTENARRDWDDKRKIYNWKKRPLNCDKATPTKYKKTEIKSLTFDEINESCVFSQTAASSDGCPRKIIDCVVCRGKGNDNIRDVEKLAFLSSTRTHEVKECLEKTFCIRQFWIMNESPTLSTILKMYPKFQTIPELLDVELQMMFSDCKTDFLSVFRTEILIPALELTGNKSIELIAADAKRGDNGWHAYHACKIISLLLRTTVKRKRISGLESFDHLMRIVEPGCSMIEAAENCWKPYPLLLIQGSINQKVLLVKIAAEKSLITAGSSIEEGIERLFKLFWCFNLEYTEECATFFKFLQLIYNLGEKQPFPASVYQLQAMLKIVKK
ncbi:uncharacterized protein LOC136087359 [Hydra vulgaris]|uniref:Uncharacterized protein LOC136087359 n=1 Tax=Hydra vulgaris TaxID=6087 RepID=A0ABM4CVK2_HYDVU